MPQKQPIKRQMKIPHLIMAGSLVLALASCGEKKQSDVIIVENYEAPEPSGPIKMDKYSDTNTISWLGAKYTYDIRRTPCDSLPEVKDEDGQTYVDNSVTLTISRSDGSVFLEKTFTKNTFSSTLTSNMNKNGILDGFIFHKVDGDALLFAASVSYPQSDESIPIIMRVSRMGDISVARDTESVE